MMQKSIFRHLYAQVLVAILVGVVVGRYWPDAGLQLRFLGDGFIKLIKMVVTPVIFCTVVIGIAGMGNLKRVGRIGLKSFLYFEIMTTLALVIGFAVVTVFKPGAGMNADVATLDTKDIQGYITTARAETVVDFFLNVIPDSIIGAFARGDILQVLFFSVLFGCALSSLGGANLPLIHGLDQIYKALMRIVGFIVRLAPLAAGGAMAFTVAKFGMGSLKPMMKLMACFYFTCLCFIFIGLGVLLKANGVSLWKFLKYIREELLIVLGTSSSESVLPRLMHKLEALGCSKPLVGLVVPAGYSFNLDGSSIYLTLGALFIAQATNAHVTFWQELAVLAVCLITSKGAAAVTGGGFITLAATLCSMKTIPVEGMVLILGVDRFMSEARALTNLIGNGVATIVIARWEKEFDDRQAAEILNHPDPAAAVQATLAVQPVPTESGESHPT